MDQRETLRNGYNAIISVIDDLIGEYNRMGADAFQRGQTDQVKGLLDTHAKLTALRNDAEALYTSLRKLIPHYGCLPEFDDAFPLPDIDPGTLRVPNSCRIDGKLMTFKSAKEVMVAVFRHLATVDQEFLQKFAEHPKPRMRRPIIARNKAELYPDRDGKPDLSEESEMIAAGWWISTNHKNDEKLKFINMACDVAGVQFGTDIDVELA